MMKRKARKPQVDSGTLPAKAVIKDMLATRPMAVVTRITAYLGPACCRMVLGIRKISTEKALDKDVASRERSRETT
jgi:hypothetical protein